MLMLPPKGNRRYKKTPSGGMLPPRLGNGAQLDFKTASGPGAKPIPATAVAAAANSRQARSTAQIGRAKHNVSQTAGLSTIQAMEHLLETRDQQEIAYLDSVKHPWSSSKARLPVTVLTGLMEVELYTVSQMYTGTVNTSGFQFASLEGDQWHGNQFLGVDGGLGKPGCVTAGDYIGTTSPAIGSGATGVVMQTLPNVSSDITSSASTGTEYAMVSGGILVSCKTLADADGFRGIIYAIATKDPERYPLTALTADAIRTAALMGNSQYIVKKYHITRDGGFVDDVHPVRDATTGYVTGGQGLRYQLGLALFPTGKQAFELHRVDGTVMSTVQKPSVAFMIQGAPAQSMEYTTVYNYQLEAYPTARVLPSLGSRRRITASNETGLLNMLSTVEQVVSKGPAAKATTSGAQAWLAEKLRENPGLKQQLLTGAITTAQILGKRLGGSIMGALKGPAKNAIPQLISATSPKIEVEVSEGVWEVLGDAAEEAVPLLEGAIGAAI